MDVRPPDLTLPLGGAEGPQVGLVGRRDAPWVLAGGAVALLIVLADVLLGQAVVLVGLLSVAPLVAGIRAGVRASALVAVTASLLALVLGAANGIFGSVDHLGRTLVVVAVGILAMRMAALRERARQSAQETRNVVHTTFESALDCIVSMDAEGRVVDLNAAAEKTFGYPRDSLRGEFLCDMIIPERFREDHRRGLERIKGGGTARILDKRIEVTAMRSSGGEFPAELTVTMSVSDPPLFTGFIRDISKTRAAERERARRQRDAEFLGQAGMLLEGSLDYEATLENIARLAVPRLADWAFVELLQEDGSIKRVAMAHSDPEKEALVREFDAAYPINPDAPEGSAKAVRTGEPELIAEIPEEMLEAVAEDDEHLRFLRELGFRSAMVVPLRARGRILGDIALVSAESRRCYDEADFATAQELAVRCALAIDNARLYEEAVRSEARLRDLALRDPLTGLANRTLFLDRLSLALARAARQDGDPALLFFDLDGFKAINDEHGHQSGDRVLKEVADRMQGLLRAGDTISRFGGDEFTILCEDLEARDVATEIARRLVATLAVPFELEGRRVQLGASLGIVFARDTDRSPESMLRDADAAMYEAKRAGGGRFHVFEVARRYGFSRERGGGPAGVHGAIPLPPPVA